MGLQEAIERCQPALYSAMAPPRASPARDLAAKPRDNLPPPLGPGGPSQESHCAEGEPRPHRDPGTGATSEPRQTWAAEDVRNREDGRPTMQGAYTPNAVKYPGSCWHRSPKSSTRRKPTPDAAPVCPRHRGKPGGHFTGGFFPLHRGWASPRRTARIDSLRSGEGMG